jgi:hypothetical protein
LKKKSLAMKIEKFHCASSCHSMKFLRLVGAFIGTDSSSRPRPQAGAEFGAEIEHQTARDSTVGKESHWARVAR